MRKYILLYTFLTLLISSCDQKEKVRQNSLPVLNDYSQLIMEENFNSQHLDTTLWEFKKDHYWNHNEVQEYICDSKQAYTEDGKLIIKASKQISDEGKDEKYYSACITSKESMPFDCGRIDVRAKMPFGTGIISGITMQPMDSSLQYIMSNSIEIAVVNGSSTSKATSIVRYMDKNHQERYINDWCEIFDFYDYSRGFHTFSVIREKDQVYFFIDGKMHFNVSKNNIYPASFPFEKAFKLMFHIAIGGDWAGKPDNVITSFPQEMQIEYVKFYKKNGEGLSKINEKNYPKLSDYEKLSWRDEFDESYILKEHWTKQTGDYWWNNEIQAYTDDSCNSYIENGNLVIQAMLTPEHFKTNRKYTSARLITRDKVTFSTGRIDFRIKVESGKGIWPAAWMLPNDNKYGLWPQSGEIDIMEIFGTDSLSQFTTAHFGSSRYDHRKRGKALLCKEGFSEDYHLYSLVKEEDHLWWYFDGKPCFHVSKDFCKPHHYPFNEKFFIILNMAIGGSTAGYPDEETLFPRKMWVDYVRIYQKE